VGRLQDSPSVITDEELARVTGALQRGQPYETLPDGRRPYVQSLADSAPFAKWDRAARPSAPRARIAAVTLSLKKTGVPPGDATAEQMDFVAELADRYSFGELRVSHEQNLILADVRKRDLFALWLAAKSQGLATPNVGLLTNIVCCPGGDFCSLANAKSIPIAEAIQRRFDDLDYLHDIGELDLNISGCMNSCGHHHIGHIGILGVDKNGRRVVPGLDRRAPGHDAPRWAGDRPVVRRGRDARRGREARSTPTSTSATRTSASWTPCIASASRRSSSACTAARGQRAVSEAA
jgi:sulfite reductase (NADPH) hemoprotein beta-component